VAITGFKRGGSGSSDVIPRCSRTGNGCTRSPDCDEKSGVTGDCHAPFRGSPGVRVPRATRLKFRYRLGYEALCREVSHSITWRRFCRIPLDRSVPHATTLMKLTTRCGSAAVDGLNEALLAKAARGRFHRSTNVYRLPFAQAQAVRRQSPPSLRSATVKTEPVWVTCLP